MTAGSVTTMISLTITGYDTLTRKNVMEVIDTVPADSLQAGDIISYTGYEIEILSEQESPDDTRVLFSTYNRDSGMVEPLSLVWDQLIDILGA